MYVCKPSASLVPLQARRECHRPWNCSNRRLLDTISAGTSGVLPRTEDGNEVALHGDLYITRDCFVDPNDDQTDMEKAGDLPKPSLRVQHLGRVTTGEAVKLQCQKPHNSTELYQIFALLKMENSSPIRLLTSENNTAEFTLQNVTSRDAGRYSCVYPQAEAPFRTSHPSDYLDISVAMSPSALSKCYTKINLIRLEMSAMFVVLMAVFLDEAWYSHRVSSSRPRPCATMNPWSRSQAALQLSMKPALPAL